MKPKTSVDIDGNATQKASQTQWSSSAKSIWANIVILIITAILTTTAMTLGNIITLILPVECIHHGAT